MKLLITKNPESVQVVLLRALDSLITNRISDGAFTDEEDVKEKSYFSTLEGLEALLIPFVNLPKNHFWDRLKNRHPDLIEIIYDDINFILRYNPLTDLPPMEQGSPYFEEKKRGRKRTPYWTSECSSFTLSVLVNFLSLRSKYGLQPEPSDNEVLTVIDKNLEWLRLCKRDIKGWSWTYDSDEHPWPTWSLIDTFDELLRLEALSTGKHDLIASLCDEVIENTVKKFKSGVTDSYFDQWNEKVVQQKPYDVQSALDLTRLMLAVSLHRTRRFIMPLAHMLFSWASKTDFSQVDYKFHLKVRSDYIVDSGLLPSVLRALIVMAGILRPKGIKDLNERLKQDHEIVINRVYSKLMESQIGHGKYKGLWGVGDERFSYELYYTERTIEALTEFLEHYESKEPVANALVDIPRGTGEEPARTVNGEPQKLEQISMDELQFAHLPILEEVGRSIRHEHREKLFYNSVFVFVLHFLNDLPPLVREFSKLGCSYKDMVFLVKTYAYPEKDLLATYFSGYGASVYIPDDPHPKRFDELASKVLLECIKKCKLDKKKLFIVEDGGYFSPLIHSKQFIDDVGLCVGAVEQTTKGYRRDQEIEDIRIPIVSIATTLLKQYLEAPEVADTLQENIISILKEYQEKPIDKVNALVIGYGTIGENLAVTLQQKRINVSIYDINFEKQLKAKQSRHDFARRVLEGLDDIDEFDIIIGTSGETSLRGGESFWNLKHNVLLASGSSERIEFDIYSLEEQSLEVVREKIITKYKIKKDKKVINLLCDGEPINFVISGGIHKSVIDPIYSEMLLAASELATENIVKPGIHTISEDNEKYVLRLFEKYHK